MEPDAPQISVAPQSVEPDPIAVSEAPPTPAISETTATSRANKHSIGSPNSPIDNQTALQMLMQGREKDLREQAATQKDFDRTVEQQRAINDIAGKQGPLTIPQQYMIRDLVRRKQADPNSIIEENYAEEFTKTLVKAAQDNPDSELAQAMRAVPEHTKKDLNTATDLKAWQEQINTWSERAQDAYEKQSWGGWGVDMLKGMVSPYPIAKMQGLVKGGLTNPALTPFLAENMTKQWGDLMFMPPAQRVALGEKILNKLIEDNPSMAMLWMSAGQGLSSTDRFLINSFPVLDLTLLGDASLLARNVRLSLAARRTMTNALKDMKEPASTAAIKEAVGDIPGAAVDQFATEVAAGHSTAIGNVTPVVNNLQSLMRSEHLRMGVDSVVGPNGPMRPIRQGLVDQLQESWSLNTGKFINAVATSMKIEQLPAVAAMKSVAQRLAADMENNFRGVVNTIADTQLVRDTATGQWFASYTMTKVGGKVFSSPKEIENYANKLGLGEVRAVEISGPGGLKTVSTTKSEQGKYLSTEAANEAFNLGKDWHPSFKATDLAPPTAVRAEQKGMGYLMVKVEPVPINSEYARDLMIVNKDQRTPNSWMSAFSSVLGSTRTPEDTMALANIMNRKVGTYGTALFNNIFKDLHESVKDLKGYPFSNKERWNQWKNVMSWLENERNPETGGKGIIEAFSSPGEFRDLFTRKMGQAPDEKQIRAAFDYRTSLILQEQVKKFNKLKNQLREGGSYVTVEGLETSLETKTSAGAIRKASFSGEMLKELPNKGTVLVMRQGELTPSIHNSEFRDASIGFSVSQKKAFEEGRLKIARIIEPDENPLLGLFNPETKIVNRAAGTEHTVDNLRITHVMSPTITDKTLSLDHIKVNPMNNHDYDHYIAQPRIKYNPVTRTYEYLGDHTIAGFNIKSMGSEVAEHLDNVRQLLKNDKDVEAEQYYKNSTLPMGWQEIKNWFKPGFSTEEAGGRLSLDERIHVVGNGKLSNEMDKEMERRFNDQGFKFVDRTRETYEQTGLRDPYDIFSLNNDGTKENPLWKVAPTKYIDPSTSINRSLVKVINDIHLNDYKVTSIEHWIQEAKDLLDVRDGSLASSPAYHFYNPVWLKGLSGKDAIRVNNLMVSQMQIKQFLGIRDSTTTFLHNSAQMLADSIYTRFGEKPYLLAMADQLPNLRDPFRFIRSVSFNAVMGLFSPAQILVQMQNFALIGGVAGWDKAAVGSAGWLMHTWSRVNKNPGMIEALDKYASKMGFQPGGFIEANRLLTKSGFEFVGVEHGYRDSSVYHDLIGSPGQTFLHWGQFFFREPERASRTAAYYTAYHEFVSANPVKKITEVDERTILQRADLLAGNMSSASSSSIQKGVFSLTNQFTTYTVRQAELMLGKRLTDQEKRRLFGTYALLYGVPAAFGAFTFGVGGNLINQAAISQGYVPESKDNSKINTIATEGLPAFLLQVLTGNLYNVGPRFGGGSGPIADVMNGDKPFMDIVLGASGSMVHNSILGMSGFATAMTAAIKGEGPFAIKPEDFIDSLRPIKSIDSATKLYQAVQTGKWLSSKEVEMGEASPLNAAFMAATGLSYSTAATLGTVIHLKNVEKQNEQKTLSQFIKEYHRGIREFRANNPEQGHDYWRRAFTSLRVNGYPEDNWAKAIGIATENEELPHKIISDYYLKNVPPKERSARWEMYQRFQQAQQPQVKK